jgi:HCOMODA/2-hydroxy-3-carboxy-muconic semialdehyde decarboxylase
MAGFAQGQKAASYPPNVSRTQVDELVLANRILTNEGVLDAYGHVSVRDERNPNQFLLARHLPASVITPSDIIVYDLDTKAVSDPKATGYSERFIHGEIYKSRPDVKAVIHTHSPDVIPFTVTSVPLRPMIHMAGFIPQNVSVFEIRDVGGNDTDMLIKTNELGHAVAAKLGADPLVLLRGHGAVVAGPSLHVTVGWAYYLGLNARTELQALMVGGGKVSFLNSGEAQHTTMQDGFERAWTHWKSRVTGKSPNN